MIKNTFAALALLTLIGSSANISTSIAAEQPVTIDDILTHAVEDYIRPGYANFAQTSAQLETAMIALCADPTEQSLSLAKSEFTNTALSWAKIELVRFGPVMQDNRLERILFWPDRKSTGLKQVQRLLFAKDPSAITRTSLRKKSVAVQGLGALEFILYGTDAQEILENPGSYRCTYGRTVASALNFTADQLVANWQPDQLFPQQFLNPAPDAATYRSTTESLSEVVGTMAHGLETIRDKRFKPILGSQIKRARPKSALFWRSDLMLKVTQANFDGLQTLLDTSQIADLSPATTKSILASAKFEFSNARNAHARITVPTLEIATNEIPRGLITYLMILTNSLQQIIGEQLATELGFSVGFSANDGD